MAEDSPTFLKAVFDHLVLPPKLPGQIDKNLVEIEYSLMSRLANAANSFGHLVSEVESAAAFQSIAITTRECRRVNAEGSLNQKYLVEVFSKLEPGRSLILHVAQQNAGLLIHHRSR